MESLNFPRYDFKIKSIDKRTKIFDTFRKKYVVLTPEEWVRQHAARFLVEELQYPPGLIVIEQSLKLNNHSKRADIVIYNKAAKPVLLVECKAPDIKLSQKTLNQIAGYNIPLQVPFLLITNGIEHYCCKIDFKNKSYHFLNTIPTFGETEAANL